MLSIFVGLVFVAVGIWGIVIWPNDVVSILKGILPLMLLSGGIIAIVAGMARFSDTDSDNAGAAVKEIQENNNKAKE